MIISSMIIIQARDPSDVGAILVGPHHAAVLGAEASDHAVNKLCIYIYIYTHTSLSLYL